MIETSNPEINVNELMDRVRQEAARIGRRETSDAPARRMTKRTTLPVIPEIPPLPTLGLSRVADPKKERLEGLLERARGMIEVSSKIPKLFHGLFRRQGGYNRALLETVTRLAKANFQLNQRVRELMIATQQQNHWLRLLAGQRQNELQWIKGTGEKLERQEQQIQDALGHAEEAATLRRDYERAGEHLRNLQAHVEPLRDLPAQIERASEHLRNLQAQVDSLRNLPDQFDRAGEHLRNLQAHVDQLGGEVEDLKLGGARSESQTAQIPHLMQMLTRLDERQTSDAIYVKGELSQHGAMLHRRVETPAATTQTELEQSGRKNDLRDHRLDSFYLSFENRFRGSRAEIKNRVGVYLPLLRDAKAGTPDRPVFDLGCGRGEWLELLQENEMTGSGVDLSGAMVAHCRQRQLQVTQGDAIEALRAMPDHSQGAVSGFHVIEHLPLEGLIDLIAESRRVLQPGGLAVFESPNCKNLMVGACNFNIDPTHRNPVFPETAQFMLEAHGFENVQLEYLSPAEGSPFTGENPESASLHRLLYGPQDFAVIGRKPA